MKLTAIFGLPLGEWFSEESIPEWR